MADIEKMVNFEKWAEGKSLLIKTAALQFALIPKDFLEFIEDMKAGKKIEVYTNLPPVKEWLNLYRNRRKVYHDVVNTLKQVVNNLSDIIDFYELLMSSFESLRHITQSELQEMIDELTLEERNKIVEQVKEKFKEIHDLIIEDDEEPEELSDEEKTRIRKLLRRPEITFYIRVWIPCFLLYGDYPPYLLRKARQGDEDALEKLLRLDKSVLGDPKIMEIFHQAAVATAQGKMTLITKALQKTPKATFNIKNIKYLFGGLLSIISIAMGQRLTAAEIHRLFDAVTQDTIGELVDPDFIDFPEAFEKGIQRARDFWKIPIPLPDKK